VVELLPDHPEVKGSKTATCTRRKESGVKWQKVLLWRQQHCAVVELLPDHTEVKGLKTATCTRRKESGKNDKKYYYEGSSGAQWQNKCLIILRSRVRKLQLALGKNKMAKSVTMHTSSGSHSKVALAEKNIVKKTKRVKR
jgi:hypothetical protein